MHARRHLKTLRALAECYHAFGRVSGAHVRELGYTPAQFDVVATLGNTPGMTFKELGAATLITKGTLTGVIDRLERMGVVRRVGSTLDRRSTTVVLTDHGEAEFARVFPAHVDHLAGFFGALDVDELDRLDVLLNRLRDGFGPKGSTSSGR